MLTVVGMGPSGLHLMTPAARDAVASADALVGGKRHLQQFPEFDGERFALGANIAELLVWLGEREAQKVVVLASGDPLFYGIGTRLIAHFGIERVRIIPGISAVQYLCAKAGIDMNDIWLTSWMVIGENLAMDNERIRWLPVSEVDGEYEMNAVVILDER